MLLPRLAILSFSCGYTVLSVSGAGDATYAGPCLQSRKDFEPRRGGGDACSHGLEKVLVKTVGDGNFRRSFAADRMLSLGSHCIYPLAAFSGGES